MRRRLTATLSPARRHPGIALTLAGAVLLFALNGVLPSTVAKTLLIVNGVLIVYEFLRFLVDLESAVREDVARLIEPVGATTQGLFSTTFFTSIGQLVDYHTTRQEHGRLPVDEDLTGGLVIERLDAQAAQYYGILPPIGWDWSWIRVRMNYEWSVKPTHFVIDRAADTVVHLIPGLIVAPPEQIVDDAPELRSGRWELHDPFPPLLSAAARSEPNVAAALEAVSYLTGRGGRRAPEVSVTCQGDPPPRRGCHVLAMQPVTTRRGPHYVRNLLRHRSDAGGRALQEGWLLGNPARSTRDLQIRDAPDGRWWRVRFTYDFVLPEFVRDPTGEVLCDVTGFHWLFARLTTLRRIGFSVHGTGLRTAEALKPIVSCFARTYRPELLRPEFDDADRMWTVAGGGESSNASCFPGDFIYFRWERT